MSYNIFTGLVKLHRDVKSEKKYKREQSVSKTGGHRAYLSVKVNTIFNTPHKLLTPKCLIQYLGLLQGLEEKKYFSSEVCEKNIQRKIE
jgi:hypothetical protein